MYGNEPLDQKDYDISHPLTQKILPPINPYAKPVNAFAATDGSLHPTREAALDVSRRAAYRDAYANATKELKTVAHLGGPFDRYQNGNGEWSRDLVIHQILTHKDRVIRILQSIPKEPT